MRVLQFEEKDRPLTMGVLRTPVAEQGLAIVQLKAAAFNRRDYWIQRGLYPGVEYPVVPGGDGAGTMNGADVIIDAGISWGSDQRVQSSDYHLVGSPGQGTFAQEIAVPPANVYPMPKHLSYEEASALPIAGVTAYRGLYSRARLSSSEKVLITGVGGGVALMAMQFAVATGHEVYVTSGSDDKIARAIALGASGGVNYKDDNWAKALKANVGGFDVIVDSAGGEPFSNLPKLCNPGGRIVIYGGSLGTIQNLSPQTLFWRQISIMGTSMGSPDDFGAMLDLVNEHQITPEIDSFYTFENANNALERLAKGEQFGKLIIQIPQ